MIIRLFTLFLASFLFVPCVALAQNAVSAEDFQFMREVVSHNSAHNARHFFSSMPLLSKRIVLRHTAWENKKGRRQNFNNYYGRGYEDGFAFNGMRSRPPLLFSGFGGDDAEMWFGGYQTKGKRKNSSEVKRVKYAHFGFDRSLNQSIVFGLLSSYDRIDYDRQSFMRGDMPQGIDWQSEGWMLGPYLVMQNNRGTVLSTHFSYGESSVDLINNTDDFVGDLEQERVMVLLSLSRDIAIGDVGSRIIATPLLQYKHFSTEQRPFVSEGRNVGFFETLLDRATIGLLLSADLLAIDGSVLTPSLNLIGHYDSIDSDLENIDDEYIVGRLELSFDFVSKQGLSWYFGGHYDVYVEDDDLRTYGGTLGMNIRF